MGSIEEYDDLSKGLHELIDQFKPGDEIILIRLTAMVEDCLSDKKEKAISK